MRRRELPGEAFLGEMVVGHKNTKVIKPFFPRTSFENIRGNRSKILLIMYCVIVGTIK